MDEAWIVGVGSTAFRRWPERGFRALASEAVGAALGDAGRHDGVVDLASVWFGNCGMGVWGQGSVRGQVVLDPLVRAGTLPVGVPILNVEGGCATGSVAFHGAVKDVWSGAADLSLAVGAEKTFVAHDPARILELFHGGIDQLHPEEWQTFHADEARRHGLSFAPQTDRRVLFVDVHALRARHHMARFGTTANQLAAVASKNHDHGADNPKAQYRQRMTVDEVLADKPVVAPLTRAMCAPMSDGAAAVLVASRRWLDRAAPEVRARAVRVRASVMAGGSWRGLDGRHVIEAAAPRAYAQAGIAPTDVHLAEVHDATAFCEVEATELLGFCDRGEGGAYAVSGATARGGDRPVNASGGLTSKGHPLGATGLGMLEELVVQLRREAGDRQVSREATIAVQQNAGGMVGLDEALCSVVVLERS